MRRPRADRREVLSKRSLHDLVQALVGRCCGDLFSNAREEVLA